MGSFQADFWERIRSAFVDRSRSRFGGVAIRPRNSSLSVTTILNKATGKISQRGSNTTESVPQIEKRFDDYKHMLFFYHFLLLSSYFVATLGISMGKSEFKSEYFTFFVCFEIFVVVAFWLVGRALRELHLELGSEFERATSDIGNEDEGKIKRGVSSFKLITDYLHKEHEFDLRWGVFLTLINGWILLAVTVVAAWYLNGSPFSDAAGDFSFAYYAGLLIYRALITVFDRRPDGHGQLDWSIPISSRMIDLLEDLKEQRLATAKKKYGGES